MKFIFQGSRKDINGHGGGAAAYIKDDINYTRKYDVEKEKNESFWLKMKQARIKESFCI